MKTFDISITISTSHQHVFEIQAFPDQMEVNCPPQTSTPTFVSVVNSSLCGKLAHTSSGMDPGICPLIVFADFARMHMEVLILDERSLLHKWYFISARS